MLIGKITCPNPAILIQNCSFVFSIDFREEWGGGKNEKEISIKPTTWVCASPGINFKQLSHTIQDHSLF